MDANARAIGVLGTGIHVEPSSLNSSEVLATLSDLEMQGIIRQLLGRQFSKVLL